MRTGNRSVFRLCCRNTFQCADTFIFSTLAVRRLFRSADDIVLQRFGQRRKECGIARHTHYKSAVFLRMLLCIEKRFPVNYIKLHVHAFLVKIAAHKRYEILKSFLSRHRRRMNFHIKKGSVACDAVVEARHWIAGRRRSVRIFAGRWRYAVRHRHMSQPSVRRRSGLCAEGHVCGYRIESRLENTAPRISVSLKRPRVSVSRISCQFVYFINIVAKLRKFVNHRQNFFIARLFFCGKLHGKHAADCHLNDIGRHALPLCLQRPYHL